MKLISILLVGLVVTGCSSMHYTERQYTLPFGVKVTELDVKRSTFVRKESAKSIRKDVRDGQPVIIMEGLEGDGVSGAKAIAQGVTAALIEGLKMSGGLPPGVGIPSLPLGIPSLSGADPQSTVLQPKLKNLPSSALPAGTATPNVPLNLPVSTNLLNNVR